MRGPDIRVRLTARGVGMRIDPVTIAENRWGLIESRETARMKRRWAWLVCLLGVLTCACLAAWVAMRRHGVAALDQGERAYQLRDWSRAALVARAALKEHPSDHSALRLLARASARLGKDELAETIYRRMGAQAMEAEDLFLLGQGLIRRNQKGPGLASLRAARDLDPDHAEALDALIKHEVGDQALIMASQDAERLARQKGWEVRGTLILAGIRHNLFNPAGALELFLEALRRDPHLAQSSADGREVKRLLARCLLETNRPGEARAQLESVLADGPDPETSWLLSRAVLMEGHIAGAKTALEAAGEFAHDDPLRHEPAPYVGAARCAGCHPKEYKTQQQSHHAATIVSKTALSVLPWPETTLVDPSNAVVEHHFSRSDKGVRAETKCGEQRFAAIVEYALGSNHQGRSFVGVDTAGEARELRISQYPAPPEWDLTSDHPTEPPGLDGYLGRLIPGDAVRLCLHCHSTNFRAIQQPAGRPEAGDHGIGCERCHGPGGHHLQAVETHFPDLAIAQPRLAQASDVVALCAQCHKASKSVSGGSDIRFQAPTLARSRCYTESGSLSCVTCHNPHRNASRNPADYESVCLQCHPAAGSSPGPVNGHRSPAKVWPPCPINPQRDCLSCHMPRVKDAVPRTVFTDHDIRVRRSE
jgi:tetratricopeptide (TPR) repeat protein